MKKVEIVLDKTRYLQRFEPNERYAKQARGIQTAPHDASEFTSVWSGDQKAFDLITARGMLSSLCEEMRWGKYDQKEIVLRFYEEQ